MNNRIIAVDCETSGLDFKRHSLLSVGAKTFDGDEFFYGECLLDNGREVDPEAMRINGLSLEARPGVYESPYFLLRDFLKWVSGCIGNNERWRMIGKNVALFDYNFIKEFAPDNNIMNRAVCDDVHSYARMYADVNGLDIDDKGINGIRGVYAVYDLLGFEREPYPHNALIGAAMALGIYKYFLSQGIKKSGD